ncbi:MAG: type II toxin-antitoxin system VapC family toxin [Chitinophagales bacterium]|nr:type II toxin-antitoxin system VapC family toxin [Chitinophagales bacterium]MCO5247751.1 type II toxin-antitoxin system VapC family toxin [Chitinophagales bacterium]
MNGNKIFIDTNIVLYLFGGDLTIAEFLDNKEIYISIITEIELLGFKNLDFEEETKIRQFINKCFVIPLNDFVKEQAIEYRKNYSLKLPDCIVAASGVYLDLPVMTSDKEFEKLRELDLILYKK